MELIFYGKGIDVTDALKETTRSKLSKLDKYFQKDLKANVTFSVEKHRQIIEVTINLPGTIIRGEESTDDMYSSIDSVVDTLDRQIRKYKDKLQKRYKNNKTIRFENVQPLKDAKEEGPKIVKRKTFGFKPMSAEEAVLQMDLLRHNFFVYRDAETNDVSVVYKRKDGDYGIIEEDF